MKVFIQNRLGIIRTKTFSFFFFFWKLQCLIELVAQNSLMFLAWEVGVEGWGCLKKSQAPTTILLSRDHVRNILQLEATVAVEC